MGLSEEKILLKEALEVYGKQIELEIVHGDTAYKSEDIVSFRTSCEGSLLTSVMKQADVELIGVGGPEAAEAFKNESLVVKLSVTADEKYGEKIFGTFIVKDAKYNDETSSIILTCYDLMIKSMVPYCSVVAFPENATDDNIDFGNDVVVENATIDDVTLGSYLQAICDYLGLVLATPIFTNSDVVIDEEKYNADYTFRDVLTEIAQAAAGTIAIKNDELYVLYPTDTEINLEPSNLKSIEIGELYGPVNSIVIARTPQEDNIYKKEEEAENICEIKIENNQLMDSHREDFIDGIYDTLYGLTYYPHEIESFGIGILDICDFFMVETLDGNTYKALHLSGETEINQGFTERTKSSAPLAIETEYKAASKTDRLLGQTILRVDKQEQLIQALITSVKNQVDEITGKLVKVTNTLEQTTTAEEMLIAISEAIEGINSVTTATGYTFNQKGLYIKKSENGNDNEVENKLDNTGMYVSREEDEILTANVDGVDAINLTSRRYLTVGNNSRLENYEDNRTACYYIGYMSVKEGN